MSDLENIKKHQWSDKYCSECKTRMTKWDERCAKALRTKPTCEKCLAARFGKTPEELSDWLDEVYKIRSCQFG